MTFSIMSDYVGYNEKGTQPWVKGKIVTGAYREDEEDVAYGRVFPFQTNNHFWASDISDTHHWHYAGYYFHNAYEKAECYFNNAEGRFPNSLIIYIGHPNYMDELLSYTNLPDFFMTGNYYYHGYHDLLGQWYPCEPPELRNLSLEDRKIYAYEILGRICHLLGDMGVPAHCHNDPHPPIPGSDESDIYEEYMKNESNYLDFMSAYNDGVSYLM